MASEALFLYGISREILPSLLSPERVLDTLEATQEVPQHPRLPSRGILGFSLFIPRGGSISLLRRGGKPGVPVGSQEEAFST